MACHVQSHLVLASPIFQRRLQRFPNLSNLPGQWNRRQLSLNPEPEAEAGYLEKALIFIIASTACNMNEAKKQASNLKERVRGKVVPEACGTHLLLSCVNSIRCDHRIKDIIRLCHICPIYRSYMQRGEMLGEEHAVCREELICMQGGGTPEVSLQLAHSGAFC
eukprot:1158404-Pelagomonas_calceolata.AAC.7